MDLHKKTMRVCVAALSCGVVFRLLSPLSSLASDSGLFPLLLYMETGRWVRYVQEQPPAQSPSAPEKATQPALLPAVFSVRDSQAFQLYDFSARQLDAAACLQKPLTWQLRQQQPTVLIVHTHATEGYEKQPGQNYEESAAYRTLDEGYNMVRIGDEVARVLEENGIGVLHDRTLHDYPSYNGAYNNSRETVERYLREYPSICLVLDIHRDAAETEAGTQMATAATVDGQDSAQLMVVLAAAHAGWEENAGLAVKLHLLLQKKWPGICRPLCFRDSRFNQDLSPGSLLIEVGTAGNSLEEALVASRALGEGIVELSAGAVTEDSAD